MAQPDGVEPPSSDLESEALATNTKAVLKLVVRVGLAPTVFLVWRVYSPLRSLLSHLTLLVAEEGLEPSRPFEQQILSLPCLPFHHSAENGWSDEIRTRVPRIKSALLNQLSYTPIEHF